jgi:hypothetical protein
MPATSQDIGGLEFTISEFETRVATRRPVEILGLGASRR